MIKEITATGRDVYEALDAGCMLLGVSREDAQFEIIDLPKKSFLGLKKLPARVRVYIEVPDAPQPKKPAQSYEPRKPAESRPARSEAPASAAPAAPAASPAAPAASAPAEGGANKHKRDRHKKKAPAAGQSAEAYRDETPRQEIEPTDAVREKAEKARVYVADILRAMGFGEIEIKPCFYEENVRLQLGGDRLGSVIGRRGETLDALQYLASLVANRGEGDYLRINIDSGNYREKRERTLEALARKLAGNALRSGRSITLEPMNPYERRIIHGTVSAMKGVTSSSTGVEPNRRVVITPDGAVAPAEGGERAPSSFGDRGGKPRHGRGGDRRPDRGGRPGGERSGDRGGRGGDRGPRPERSGRRDDPPAIGGPVRHESAAARPEKTAEEKALTESASLYGKIEL